MNNIFHKLSFNMQNKVLPQIFIYVKTYKSLLIKQLNSYIKYSKYNILYNKFKIQTIKLPSYDEPFYSYFFRANANKLFY